MIRNSEFDEWVRNKALRQAFVPWIAELRPWTYFGTVAPCPGLSTQEYLKSLRIWDAKVCRSRLGFRWQQVAKEDRPLTAVFFEGGPKSQTLHAHMLVYVPPELRPGYGPMAEAAWNGLAQNRGCGRNLRLDPIRETLVDRLRVANYATKKLAAPQHMGTWNFIP